MRIVVAPNAFKGSLNALKAADAMKQGALAACPNCQVDTVPVADGGDGLTDIMIHGLGGEKATARVTGPRMERLQADFCLVPSKKIAVIEMARASGLTLVPAALRDPTQTTTYGTGELIRAALDRGAERIIVGIGGSATCDGGIGMAAALGFRFLDKNGVAVEPVGASLQDIVTIDTGGLDPRIQTTRIDAACDVTNPLTGDHGAAKVYAPQKGATPNQVAALDRGLSHLADIIHKKMNLDVRDLPGAGAAGGLGAGLLAFLGAKLIKGIDLVIDIVGLEEAIQGADMVLTGEGQIDYQTQFNKAPAGVARAAKAAGVPCLALCGSIGNQTDDLHGIGIDAIFSICDKPLSLDEAMDHTFDLLAASTEQAVRAFAAGRAH
jgi:glycerate kinase